MLHLGTLEKSAWYALSVISGKHLMSELSLLPGVAVAGYGFHTEG